MEFVENKPVKIELGFRPASYFGRRGLERRVLAVVRDKLLRKNITALFAAGRHDEVPNLLSGNSFSVADRMALESVYSMSAGATHLPDNDRGEVEVARMIIRSTPLKVIAVFAHPEGSLIHYRVVDEHGGDALQGPLEATTSAPMTLGEIANFLLNACPLFDVLEDEGFEGDVEGALGFFSADSDFYPALDALCRQRVRSHYRDEGPGDECPFCGYFNSPPEEDLCVHAVAWCWDGEADSLGAGEAFKDAISALYDLVLAAEDQTSVRAMLDAQARRFPDRAELIAAAELPIAEALERVANAQNSGGWSTKGMLGGYGYTVCVPDPAVLERLASDCLAICQACDLVIETADEQDQNLQDRRPSAEVPWQLIASGAWDEDLYHSGSIAYFLANPGPGVWVVEAVERDASLDDVTEEDIEEGNLNDDQIQALWGLTLEEARSQEHRFIAAYVEGVDPELTAVDMAAVIYPVVCQATGKEIFEFDDLEGLLED
jgi:hypothetical protein